MTDHVFNHIGLCVTDLARSRRFYEDLLGFQYWWEFEVPDDQASPVLRIPSPLGLSAVYLVHGATVLELLHYTDAGAHPPAQPRTMNELGLTHLSLSVEDLDAVLGRVSDFGGDVLSETRNEAVAFIRDPDGQLLELSTMDWRQHLPPPPTPRPPASTP